jgi:peroxiredoxin
MNRSTLISAASAFALMTALAACTPGKEDKPPKPKVTENAAPAKASAAQQVAALPKMGPAPAWKLQDVDGKVVSSDQFKGKVVVLDFWATWCPPCRAEIPGYTELMRKYEKEGLVIIGASVDQGGAEVVKPFAQKMGINYPLVMADEAIATAFGATEAIPTTVIIDRDGQVRHRKVGAEETSEYEKTILSVLREKT